MWNLAANKDCRPWRTGSPFESTEFQGRKYFWIKKRSKTKRYEYILAIWIVCQMASFLPQRAQRAQSLLSEYVVQLEERIMLAFRKQVFLD